MPIQLTARTLAEGVEALSRRDPHLAAVVARFGPPPLWDRAPGFETLVQIVLEQQVSLASGRAAYTRLERVAGDVTAERVAVLGDAALERAGLTRQKASYIRDLAQAIVRSEFDPVALLRMEDDEARAALTRLRGVGTWTADIYLLMALGRPDIWPAGDLALVTALREVKRMRALPTAARLGGITRAWRPWRAVAARILWHHYLSTPRTRPASTIAARSHRPRTAPLSPRPDQRGRRSGTRLERLREPDLRTRG